MATQNVSYSTALLQQAIVNYTQGSPAPGIVDYAKLPKAPPIPKIAAGVSNATIQAARAAGAVGIYTQLEEWIDSDAAVPKTTIPDWDPQVARNIEAANAALRTRLGL